MTARIPGSTYRLQFNRNLRLSKATELVEYLHHLGITDCYASPLLKARPGSMHGYDVIDHRSLNPEIGNETRLARFSERLRKHAMGLVLDIVPNHMCISDPGNEWWWDVLENGPSSPYATFFDIDWHPPTAELGNKILLPVLHDQYGRVLENQEISIAYGNGAFVARYHQATFPLTPRSWLPILSPVAKKLEEELGENDLQVQELESIITALGHLPTQTETDPEKMRERQREKEIIKRRLAALVEHSPTVAAALQRSINEINGTKGDPHSFDRLEEILAEQAYRLSFWHVASDEINYRRFFDVNELAALRVEQPACFQATHELTFRLIREGWVTGLRVDHVDGLYDPEQYLTRLQREAPLASNGENGGAAVASDEPGVQDEHRIFLVVEKILGEDEELRARWPVFGTTGYEFLNDLNGLFVDENNRRRLTEIYCRFTGLDHRFSEVVYQSKKLILDTTMSGELTVLGQRLDRISNQHRWTRDFTQKSLQQVLIEVIACLPVYRTYVRAAVGILEEEDRRYIQLAISRARRRNPVISGSTFNFLGSVLLLEHPEGLTEAQRQERDEFVMRFQQFTGPVMAKGFEDTASYRFYPLASLNEVGGNPERFGISAAAFHVKNQKRLEKWPHGLSATSTHDTKRSEDVRARINVLSEIPDVWEEAIHRWHQMNQDASVKPAGAEIPDANEEYLFYQTLIGAWPLEPLSTDQMDGFVKRIQQYMDKAVKEAKLNTSWINVNEAHDNALRAFIKRTLEISPVNKFLDNFREFHRPIARAGMLNSLAQVAIKIASPGVADFYQGTELWDLSLVDPDNRRPVDYAPRREILSRLRCVTDQHRTTERAALLEQMLARPEDGAIKMFVTMIALNFRSQKSELFGRGEYLPLDLSGELSRHAIAFARRSPTEEVVTVVGRFFTKLRTASQWAAGADTWRATFLGGLRHQRYRELFTGRMLSGARDGERYRLEMSQVFEILPVAMLVHDESL